MKQIGSPNSKAIYHKFGMIADDCEEQQEKIKVKGKFSKSIASQHISALLAQMKVQDSEVKAALATIKVDTHNRTYGTNFKIRNVESKNFDELTEEESYVAKHLKESR